jgi:4a-hydroxytetrahydrobiopterin dehydratase
MSSDTNSTEAEIAAFLNNHPRWWQEADQLVGEWQFDDFSGVRDAVTELCDLADELYHHPTVTYGFNEIKVATTTHDAGGVITAKDLELADRISGFLG